MKEIFLENLPKKKGVGYNKNKLVIDWKNSIGYKVHFIYYDIEDEIEIIDYKSKGQTLTIKYKENGFIFYRPLLKYSKDYLLKYCNKFHIPYSIDKSNFDTKYLRNNLRINYVSKLTKEERKNIKKDIFEDNRILKNKLDLIKYIKLFYRKMIFCN